MPCDVKPNKVVHYPIAESPEGGVLHLFFEPTSSDSNKNKKLVLMSAGFPDDHETFVPFALKLSKDLNAFVGVTCLPGYHDSGDNQSWTRFKKNGFTFDEMANAFREASKMLRKEYALFCANTINDSDGLSDKKVKFTGIFHDWGVVPGLIWANRALAMNDLSTRTGDGTGDYHLAAPPDELVLFDVLLPPHAESLHSGIPLAQKPSFYEIFIALSYRGIFALCFMAQLYLGKIVGVVVLAMGILVLKVFHLSPTLNIDAKVVNSRKPPLDLHRMIYMMYPYYHMFQSMLTSKGRQWLEDATLPRDLSQTPVLYMYGTEKRIMFHDYASKKLLELEHEKGTSKSNVIAVENAGHWLYSDLQKFQYCFDCVVAFMKEE